MRQSQADKESRWRVRKDDPSYCGPHRHYGSVRKHPLGFIETCLPAVSRIVPTGSQRAYEIKHDGFRFICRTVLKSL